MKLPAKLIALVMPLMLISTVGVGLLVFMGSNSVDNSTAANNQDHFNQSGLSAPEAPPKPIVAALTTAVGAFAASLAAAILLLHTLLKKHLLRPLARIETAIQQLPDSNLRRFSKDFSSDELGGLATAVEIANCRLHQALRAEVRHRKLIERSNDALLKRLHAAEADKEATIDASKARGEVIAQLSHDIRTPLQGVLGTAELMSLSHLEPSQQEHMETLMKASQALLELLDGILELARVEAGKPTLDVSTFSLPELVNDVVELSQFQARKKQLSIIAKIDLPSAHRLRGDPARLRRILTNLVSNAVKFTTKGEISINVRHEPHDERSGWLLFQVSDTGSGIRAESLARIFEPFEKGHDSTVCHSDGSGLGLAICKQLVEQMGGHIFATSTVGVGSTFSFRIPLPPSSEEEHGINHPGEGTALKDRGSSFEIKAV